MKSSNRKRRAFLVRHESHRRLTLGISLILLALVLVSGVSFYFLAEKRLAQEYFRAHSQIRTVMQMLLPWLAGVYVLGMAATFMLAIVYTRRLAGPMVKFNQELDKLIQGDYTTRIQLRKNDEFQALGAKINELSVATSQKFSQFSSCNERLGRMVERMKTLSAQGSKVEHEVLAREISETKQQLSSLLAEIRF